MWGGDGSPICGVRVGIPECGEGMGDSKMWGGDGGPQNAALGLETPKCEEGNLKIREGGGRPHDVGKGLGTPK